jgi:hypothetical protein
MADITLSTGPVKQFSVFTENRVGRLFDLTSLLSLHNVHIMAVTVLDTTESAIMRLIVDDPDRTRELLVKNHFPCVEEDILAVELSGEASLKQVLAALLEAEINIQYVYAFSKRPEGRTGVCAPHGRCGNRRAGAIQIPISMPVSFPKIILCPGGSVSGLAVLYAGIGVCALGLLFGWWKYLQTRRLPVHPAMAASPKSSGRPARPTCCSRAGS